MDLGESSRKERETFSTNCTDDSAMDGLDRNRKTKNIQKEKKDRQQAKMNVYQHFCYHNLLFLSERENQNL